MPRARALPLPARALGAQRGSPLRGLGPALGRVLLRPPRRRSRRGPRLRRGALGDRLATGHPDVLAALAHALGETALAEGDADVAAEQIERAAEIHESLEIPFERAQIQLRAGVALGGGRAGARQRSSGSAGARDAPARSAPRRSRPRGGRGGRARSASRSRRGSAGAPPPITRTAACHAGSSRCAARRRRSHEPRDRRSAGAQHPHDRHARAQHPREAGCSTRTEAAAKAGDLGLLVCSRAVSAAGRAGPVLSNTLATSATRLAGKPPVLACS